MYIDRKASELILKYLKYFPVVCITGPRQSGKTTLIKKLFGHMPYFSFEDPDTRLTFSQDPRGFLNSLPGGAVFDEAQHSPEIFSYVQGIVDNSGFSGKFILSGSQNFLLLNKVTQTLAGRTGIVKLLPFSFSELGINASLNENNLIFKGFYPRLYDNNIPPKLFYPNYLQTYIERDIANIKTVQDKTAFYRFLKLCAARCGQLLNYSQLAVDCSIAVNTAKAWISLLESSFILFLLPPYYMNISKQLIKSPKLYFYDTGLASFLLDVSDEKQWNNHYLKGGLFENLVIADVMKQISYSENNHQIYFIRDKTGHEIDLMIKNGGMACAEIKSGETFDPGFVKNLLYYKEYLKPDALFLIYSGSYDLYYKGISPVNWRNTDVLFKKPK
jgi:hypothetical protein